ncbi:hypothetical protein CLAFUW4_07745 [Fulvia fulva]|uniref:DUF6604 domain-containing protein n=1 Tax=Passalora fulva TaxID=5499 RepID=A0A9Q8LCY9_PASFU|nr:uncharacterized protein CLAFUR5_07872 [Fulvia fulva]KAK4629552.1 hypothetical protein CLAFUR4_07750 [Fulvia fulva]KAK4630693.1 hypothetical protein CLAFUR0_07748 [Fulvia fulva]UJO15157.1 hypothetical protein CLAFUR5_07872 [Fulvia fulva]WPV13002.1 hypothetical protein CLAFUW4_07745 [Fulvia fulva]WPV27181.1 hypothetical protein CLAFUW7_07746 [Fulvia fulva]
MSELTLVNTYKRYKAGTEKLVRWLVESADSCTDTNTIRRPSKNRVTRKVRTVDLVDFAERVVAAKDPLVNIPLEILDITKDAITGRTSCAEFYASLALGSDIPSSLADSNATHQHFLKVLIQVFAILRKEHKARRPKRKKKMPELATDTNDLANLYQHLELQETTDLPEGEQTSTKRPAKKAKAAPSKQHTDGISLDNEHEEMMFAIWALLKDLADLRSLVRDVFAQFKSGEVSWRTTCQAASNAMHMGGLLGYEFGDAYPEAGSFDQIISLLDMNWVEDVIRSSQTQGGSVEAETLQGGKASQGMTDQARLLIADGWLAMSDLMHMHWVFDNGKDPGAAEVRRTILPCSADLHRHPFTFTLLAIGEDLARLEARLQGFKNHAHPLLDKYTMSLVWTLRSDRLDIGVVAATGIYCDIYDALQGDLGYSLREVAPRLTSRAQNTLATIKAFSSAADDYIKAHIAQGLEDLFEEQGDMFKSEDLDDGTSGWGCWCWTDRENCKKAKVFIPFTLLAALPVLPAHILDETSPNVQALSGMFCSNLHIVLAALYLHRAGQLSGALTKRWPEMEAVIAGQDMLEKPMLRPGNGTVMLLAKQYSLALGLSLGQVAGASKPHLTSRAAHKFFPPMEAFSLKAKSHTKTMNTIKRLNFEPYVGSALLYDCVRLYASLGSGIKDQTIAQQWKDTKRLSPMQLHAVLQEVARAEEPYVDFSYVAFSLDCLSFLAPATREYMITAGEYVPKRPLFEITHDVLWDAGHAELRVQGKKRTSLAVAIPELNDLIECLQSQVRHADWSTTRHQPSVASAARELTAVHDAPTSSVPPAWRIDWTKQKRRTTESSLISAQSWSACSTKL